MLTFVLVFPCWGVCVCDRLFKSMFISCDLISKTLMVPLPALVTVVVSWHLSSRGWSSVQPVTQSYLVQLQVIDGSLLTLEISIAGLVEQGSIWAYGIRETNF